MKLDQLLALILPAVAFFVNKSNALHTSTYVELPDHPSGAETYAWIIGKDEEHRMSKLLEHDISGLDFLGFYMTAPPQVCGHCGKKSEVIDWMYTALNRGVHSKEWIVQAIRDGTISRKAAHDVYCSHCGHLTVFRDHSGDEGPAPHITEAIQRAPFDRASKTFIKRGSSLESTAGDAIKSARADMEERAPEIAGSDAELKGTWNNVGWLMKESAAEESSKAITEVKASPSTEADEPGEEFTGSWARDDRLWLIRESAAEEAVKKAVAEGKTPKT